MIRYYNIHNMLNISIRGNKKFIEHCEHRLRYFRINKVKNKNKTKLKIIQSDKQKVKIKNSVVIVNTDEMIYSIHALIKLALKDVALIHGAGFVINNKGYLFPASGGVGKTILISAFRKRKDFRFFGDDFIIIKDNNMYSYPIDFSFYDYHFKYYPELKERKRMNNIKRTRKIYAFLKFLPFKNIKNILKNIMIKYNKEYLFSSYLSIPAEKLINKKRIGNKHKINYIILLERKNNINKLVIKKINLEDIVDSTLKIVKTEWKETIDKIPEIDINNLRKNIKNVYRGKKTFKISIPTNLTGKEYIKEMKRIINMVK